MGRPTEPDSAKFVAGATALPAGTVGNGAEATGLKNCARKILYAGDISNDVTSQRPVWDSGKISIQPLWV